MSSFPARYTYIQYKYIYDCKYYKYPSAFPAYNVIHVCTPSDEFCLVCFTLLLQTLMILEVKSLYNKAQLPPWVIRVLILNYNLCVNVIFINNWRVNSLVLLCLALAKCMMG